MPVLIDGYNLMHAIGLIQGRRGALEYARLRLLEALRSHYGDQAGEVTVVFDAARAPRKTRAEQDYHGIRVRFAVSQPQADDLIEDLIRREPTPQRLTVVSNDQRLQQAARRRKCAVVSCGEFMDLLAGQSSASPGQPLQASSERETPAETDHWLKEFGDLDRDPRMKELFGDYGMADDEDAG